MSLKSWTACIVSTLLGVALTSYLLADEQTEPEPVKNVQADVAKTPEVTQAEAEKGRPDARAEYEQKLKNAKQLVDEGRYTEAIEPLQELLLIGRHPLALLELARCFVALEEYDFAISNYSKALNAPGAAVAEGLIADVHLERGMLYLKLGRVHDALSDFVEGTSTDPLNADLLYARGLAQLEIARNASADESPSRPALINYSIKSFDRAVSVDDGHALAYYERGMAKAMLGQEAEAREDIQRALTTDDKGELSQRLANLTVDLMHENRELKQRVSTLEVEAAEVTEGDDFKGQVGEMVDTLRQIRDLLAEPRGRGSVGTTGAGDSLNKGGF